MFLRDGVYQHNIMKINPKSELLIAVEGLNIMHIGQPHEVLFIEIQSRFISIRKRVKCDTATF